MAAPLGERPPHHRLTSDAVTALMPWIRWIDEADADGRLAELYARYGTPAGMAHILKIHSLNPESLEYHVQYYRHLMFGPSGLSRPEREMLAVVVSHTNDCFY